MVDDEFNELVKHKFAELERKHGRVPTIPELATALGVDSRMLARKLRKAIATLGTETQTEGTSAFKSTLSELLSGDILIKGVPGFMDLNMLVEQAKHDRQGFSEMRWAVEDREYCLLINFDTSGIYWSLHSNRGREFQRVTNDISDICTLLEAIAKSEEVDKSLLSHMSGEPVPYEYPELPGPEYQDPIPAQNLPPNVLPFRKPYQHSED